MSLANRLERVLEAGRESNGFVVFSSAAALISLYGKDSDNEIDNLINLFDDVAKDTNVLLPSFPRLASPGVINLDTAKSANGLISERFRSSHSLNRTKSSYFSFTAIGPDQDHIASLSPQHAWGPGSAYEWIESQDLNIITIGLPTYVCSVQHRAEYLNKEHISYRQEVTRENAVVWRESTLKLKETLFARREGFEVDFRPIEPLLGGIGQVRLQHQGIVISCVSAKLKVQLASSMIERNSTVFLRKHEN